MGLKEYILNGKFDNAYTLFGIMNEFSINNETIIITISFFMNTPIV